MPSPRSCIEPPMRPLHVELTLRSDFLGVRYVSKTQNQRSPKVRWPYVCERLGNIAPLANQTRDLQARRVLVRDVLTLALVWEEG